MLLNLKKTVQKINLFINNLLQKFKCHRKGKCEITINTRKHCSKCRLNKSLAVGMRLDQSLNKTQNNSSSPNDSPKNVNNLKNIEIILDNLIKQNLPNESTGNQTLPNLKPIRRHATQLTQYEWSKIKEIQTGLSTFEDETKLPVSGQASNLIDGLIISPFYLQKIISFCKSITLFNCFGSADFLQIFKQFCSEMMFVRTAFLFDREKNGFYTINVCRMQTLLHCTCYSKSHKLSKIKQWKGYLI